MARGSRFGAGYVRKEKRWTSLPGINLALVASGTTIGGSINFGENLTVMRMIGEYILGPTGAITAGDACSIKLGIGVVSTDAATLGATAVPDPGGEPSYPWLFWATHAFFYPTTGAPLQPAGDQESTRRAFDIRSMRKMKPRESLLWIVEYVDDAGTPPMQLKLGQTRVLVAES